MIKLFVKLLLFAAQAHIDYYEKYLQVFCFDPFFVKNLRSNRKVEEQNVK